MADLDSGCMKTVVGRVWLEENVKTLSESNKKCAKHLPTEDIFWFGDGKEVVASKEVLLFPLIGEKRIVINAKVVDNNILLLLSQKSMRLADTTMDFTKDEVNMLGGAILGNNRFRALLNSNLPINHSR